MSIQIVRNDIVNMKTDAIVDPTDERYSGSGGADYAIHTAAGPGLRRACDTLLPCSVGEARITPGFNLKAKYVIHTVGPRWQGGDRGENVLLRNCYRSALELAADAGLGSIAIPLLASGTFGYPKAEAINVAMSTIREFLTEHEMIVYLVVFNKEALRLSEERYGAVASYISSSYRPAMPHSRKDIIEKSVSAYPIQDADVEDASEKPIRRNAVYDSFCEALPSAEAPKRREPKGLWGEGGVPSSLEERLKYREDSFCDTLIKMIDARGWKDSECYKQANVDKTVFNKIKNKPGYKPQKSTVIALAFALKPTADEFYELLNRAGFALSNNNAFDIIIRYCLEKKIFDVYDANDLLFQFDQPLLGSK